MFNYTEHIKNSVTKAKTKINILKALAGSTWGQEKETILITCKSICRSTLEYAAPVWAPPDFPVQLDSRECKTKNSELRKDAYSWQGPTICIKNAKSSPSKNTVNFYVNNI